MNNIFNQKALLISITTFAFMSTASANGKWIISGNSLLNLNNYSLIKKRITGCGDYQETGTGLLILFSGDSEFKLSVASCTKFNDENARDRLEDVFEEIVDFLKDDDEYLVLD
jgi:ATP-dependent Zn protease